MSTEQKPNDLTDLTAAMQEWASGFGAESPEPILACYAPDAVLWGTLSPERRDTPAAVRDYFEKVFALCERRVTFHDPLIRIYGDAAVNTGAYTFSWVRDGKTETIAARYSMTYVKRHGRWLIVDHHSSMMPESPL